MFKQNIVEKKVQEAKRKFEKKCNVKQKRNLEL